MSEKKPVNVLFDLDIAGDCTNMGAFSVLHALADLGEARILAVTACYHSPYIAGCIDAVNRYYKRRLPLGTLHRQPPTEHCVFTKEICEEYESDYPAGAETADTVDVLRKALSEAADHSVLFVVTGCMASMAALLDSPADAFSPLDGRTLIAQKIEKTIVMGGQFPTFGDAPHAEFNITAQIPAAQHACECWPGELILTPFELGIRTRTAYRFVQEGTSDNPVRRGYELLRAYRDEKPDDDFPSWDATAVLQAVRPDAGYFELHPYGKITVDDKGYTVWSPCEGGKQTYLCPKMPLDEVGETITALLLKTPTNR